MRSGVASPSYLPSCGGSSARPRCGHKPKAAPSPATAGAPTLMGGRQRLRWEVVSVIGPPESIHPPLWMLPHCRASRFVIIIAQRQEKGNPPFRRIAYWAVSHDPRNRKSGQVLTPCGVIEGTAVAIVAPLQRRKAQRFFQQRRRQPGMGQGFAFGLFGFYERGWFLDPTP